MKYKNVFSKLCIEWSGEAKLLANLVGFYSESRMGHANNRAENGHATCKLRCLMMQESS